MNAGPHVAINRDYWNGVAHQWVAAGERLWASEPRWGNWGIPETELGLLPADMTGMATIELGCGTGYVSGWMVRRGATATAIDVSAEQLATARRLAGEHKATIDFLEGNAETVPFDDGAFDFAISEYGAAIWCDPELWLREAWRLLRPGGRLVFLGSHPLTIITTPLNGAPCETVLHRPYWGLSSVDWSDVEIDPGGFEFNRTFEGWIGLFHDVGFRIEHYREIYAPAAATEAHCYVPAEWAKDYPSEQVWWLKKTES